MQWLQVEGSSLFWMKGTAAITHKHASPHRPHGLQQHNSTGIAKHHRLVRLSGDLQTTFLK